MIWHKHLEHKFVDEVPEQLGAGFLYVSMRYATVVHLCCCGCEREVVTPLSPAQWRLTFDGECVSLHPSIGSWALPCRSHYIITNGRVIEASSWSDEEVEYGLARDKRARSAHYGAKAAASTHGVTRALTPRKGWLSKISNLLTRKG